MRSEIKIALMDEIELKKAIQSALSKTIETKENSETEKMQEDNLKFYSIQEACKLLNCCRTTIYNWSRQGLINYKKVGRKVLFTKKDLENCGSSFIREAIS